MLNIKDSRLLIAVLIASQFAPPFMFSGVAVALPTMGKYLGIGVTTLSLVETLFLAAQMAFLLPIGRLADTNDKRNLYKLGLFSFGGASLLISMSHSIVIILFLRIVQGIGSGLFAATGPAILADLVSPQKRGKVYGASSAMTYCGLMLGPLCAGFLTNFLNWQAVFIVGGATILSGLLLLQFAMPSKWHLPSMQAVHIPSTLLMATSVFLLVAGSANMANGLIGYGFLTIGIFFCGCFVWLQKRLEHPLLNLSALAGNGVLRDAILIQLLLYMYAFCSVFIMSLLMQVSLGHSPKVSGQVIAVGTAIMIVTSPVAGILADKYRARYVTIIGVVSVLIAALMGTALGQGTHLFYIALMMTIQSFGFAMFSSPNMKIIMESVPSEARGTAGALSAKGRYSGMILGMLLATIVVTLKIGNQPVAEHPTELIQVTKSIFSLLIIFVGASLSLAFFTRKHSANS